MLSTHQAVSLVASSVAWAIAALADEISIGDVLIVVGAIVFALATWRTQRTKALRDTNADLAERVAVLEKIEARLVEENRALKAELAARPELGQVVSLLREIRTAVVPPPIIRED